MSTKAKGARVLIKCGQGCLVIGPDGQLKFRCEHPKDHRVYIQHAIDSGHLLENGYTDYVLAGTNTQPTAPEQSEADGLALCVPHTLLTQMGLRTFKEKLSACSTENVFLGLMAARKGLGTTPIIRVGVSVCWPIKKRRFELAAAALGIEEFTFHGFARNEDAADPARLVSGEEKQVAEMIETGDHLLLGQKWEDKRRSRYQLPGFDSRFSELKRDFPRFFAALDAYRENGQDPQDLDNIRNAFRDEVLLVS